MREGVCVGDCGGGGGGCVWFFFFNDTATTEIYTLSLHDALPISSSLSDCGIALPCFCYILKAFARGGARTHDPGIKSPMLYRLSYPGLHTPNKKSREKYGP